MFRQLDNWLANRQGVRKAASVMIVLAALMTVTLGFANTHTASAPGGRDMFLENQSPGNLVRTVEVFQEEVRAAGWSMLHVHNISGILSARGFTLDPVLIFEPCSGRFTAALMGNDETRYVASMIPCRVAIYQTSDGRVIISRMNIAMFAAMMEPRVAEVMLSANEEMEAIIAKTLARLQ
ncbi:MAG: DUF302 domain-containing protein [Truepera sp.]|nr:DUF302 domain-containing protein [Truepera sp.]